MTEATESSADHQQISISRVEKFAETALKDALEGIHKAASTRAAIVGIFAALVTGASIAAGTTRAYGFFLLADIFLFALIFVEFSQRSALRAYCYRYMQIAGEFYGRGHDFAWLTSFMSSRLLQRFHQILSKELSEDERQRQFRLALRDLQYGSFSMAVVLIALVFTAIAASMAMFGNWPFMPKALP